jgi:hypothetical protein
VKKANEYREHAQECLSLARKAQTEEQRDQFLNMAQTWESLAHQRELIVREKKELDVFESQTPLPLLNPSVRSSARPNGGK